MTRPGWNPPSPEREIGRGIWRDDQLERRVIVNGFYEVKLYPDRDHPVAIETPELAIVQAGDNQFAFPIPRGLEKTSLIWAEAGISFAGSSDLEVMIVRETTTRTSPTDMLTSPIVIAAGDFTSYVPADSSVIDPDEAKVQLGEWIRFDVLTDGGGDAEGLVVMVHFS